MIVSDLRKWESFSQIRLVQIVTHAQPPSTPADRTSSSLGSSDLSDQFWIKDEFRVAGKECRVSTTPYFQVLS